MDRTRREFLVRTGCAALGMAAFQAGLDKLGLISAYARPAAADYRALVCVFLGGGNDGNSMIVPLDTAGFQAYSDARTGSGLCLDQSQYLSVTPATLGTPFGFHPSMTELPALFADQQLAVVANVGPLVQPLTRDAVPERRPAAVRSLLPLRPGHAVAVRARRRRHAARLGRPHGRLRRRDEQRRDLPHRDRR